MSLEIQKDYKNLTATKTTSSAQQKPKDIKIDFSNPTKKSISSDLNKNDNFPQIHHEITKNNGEVTQKIYFKGKLGESSTKNEQGQYINFQLYSVGQKTNTHNYDKKNGEYTHTSQLQNGQTFHKITIKDNKIRNEVNKEYNQKEVSEDKNYKIISYTHSSKNGVIREYYDKKSNQLIKVLSYRPWNKEQGGLIFEDTFNPQTGNFSSIMYKDGSMQPEFTFDKKNKIKISQEKIKAFREIEKRYHKERTPIVESTKTLPFNGEFDKPITQSAITGNCFVLAPLISMNKNSKEILKECLSIDPKTGDVTVKFKNGKSYTFKQDEVRNDPRFSKGDPDVKAIEMAVEQYYKDTYNETTAHGSISDPIFELFIGNAQSYGPKIRPDIKANGLPVDNKLINGFNDKNKIFSTAFTKIPFAQISDDGTKKDILSIAHAYSIIGSDEKHVYIINPHDSSKTIKITRELFLANVENVVSADIPQK